MANKATILITLAVVVMIDGINCSSVAQCLNYYRSGVNYDLNMLQDGQFYVVYYWPPISTQREQCQVMSFRKLTNQEVSNETTKCPSSDLSSSATVIEASYTNAAKRPVSYMYYGNEEVKRLYRSCDRIYDYLLIQVSEDYVLGINCSKGGRGMLLSKVPPSAQEVRRVVDSIVIMHGRDGSPDCKLIP